MDLEKTIQWARATAQNFAQRQHQVVRLPAFSFEDWMAVYGRPSDGASLSAFRTQQRRNFYLAHFLRDQGMVVEPVPIMADNFQAWAQQEEHKLDNGHELAHAVGDYVNQPLAPLAACRHQEEWDELEVEPGDYLATITVFGESEEAPEVMSVVLHEEDGRVIYTMELLAAEMSPQQAWDQAKAFLNRHRPKKVFHDQTVRRPEFCADCNGLMVNVASSRDVEASG